MAEASYGNDAWIWRARQFHSGVITGGESRLMCSWDTLP
jgi:hypothetical protein